MESRLALPRDAVQDKETLHIPAQQRRKDPCTTICVSSDREALSPLGLCVTSSRDKAITSNSSHRTQTRAYSGRNKNRGSDVRSPVPSGKAFSGPSPVAVA
jgi:hypothetical protein